jgi:hypothetical protein
MVAQSSVVADLPLDPGVAQAERRHRRRMRRDRKERSWIQSVFDGISKLFAQRRLSRRQAMRTGGSSLAAGALAAAGFAQHAGAQDATPAATPSAATGSGDSGQFLFVQSFQQGHIAPKAGTDGTYTLTLEQGLGQTIYFSNRPERIVGAAPTDQFLKGLGFPADNPPNAALVLEAGPGDEDIAVLELYNPRYDTAAKTATYDVTVLDEYQKRLGMSFTEQPTDLAQLPPDLRRGPPLHRRLRRRYDLVLLAMG